MAAFCVTPAAPAAVATGRHGRGGAPPPLPLRRRLACAHAQRRPRRQLRPVVMATADTPPPPPRPPSNAASGTSGGDDSGNDGGSGGGDDDGGGEGRRLSAAGPPSSSPFAMPPVPFGDAAGGGAAGGGLAGYMPADFLRIHDVVTAAVPTQREGDIPTDPPADAAAPAGTAAPADADTGAVGPRTRAAVDNGASLAFPEGSTAAPVAGQTALATARAAAAAAAAVGVSPTLAADLDALYGPGRGGYAEPPSAAVTAAEPPHVAALRRATLLAYPYGDAVMALPAAQVPVLTLLARAVRASRVLEVGTFTGLSALVWAEAVGPDGTVVTIDAEGDGVARLGAAAWAAAGVDRVITPITADGLAELSRRADSAEAGSWDVVYVDADKERVGAYYEVGLSLVRQGGLVLVDDVTWSGRVAAEEEGGEEAAALRAVCGRAAADPRVVTMTVEAGDGLLVVLKL